MDSNSTIKRCNELKRFWGPRDKRFKEWYRLISMVDELKQEGMESFVSNDPLSSYRLLRHMLSQRIPHRPPQEELTVENANAAALLSSVFESLWSGVEANYRRRGREGWLWDLVGFILATGWYSVFATIPDDGKRVIAEVWNPATVYPAWDDDLVECAHIEDLSAESAKRMAIRNAWPLDTTRLKGSQRLFDYWRLDQYNHVYDTVVLGTQLMKPETHEVRLDRIPIFISPVGGLPDSGSITGEKDTWKGQVGMSSASTNENIYKYWNKWWTFNMQHLRDIVQARLIEKNRSGQPIVKPENVFKRGAIFRMTPEEDVYFLQHPALPVEMRTTMLDMEAMMQRGGPAWSMFGAVQGQTTAYVMSQIAASTEQAAKPFHKGVIHCLTDIDNFWLDLMKKFNYKPLDRELPAGLPPEMTLTAEYELRIPGDLIQRATVARMLDPDFRFSYSRVVEEVFPEIKSPIREKARVRADEAERHPVHAVIALIRSLKEEAEELRKAGDTRGATLYDKAAERAEAMLEAVETPEGAPGRAAIGNRTEALPPGGTTSAPTPVA